MRRGNIRGLGINSKGEGKESTASVASQTRWVYRRQRRRRQFNQGEKRLLPGQLAKAGHGFPCPHVDSSPASFCQVYFLLLTPLITTASGTEQMQCRTAYATHRRGATAQVLHPSSLASLLNPYLHITGPIRGQANHRVDSLMRVSSFPTGWYLATGEPWRRVPLLALVRLGCRRAYLASCKLSRPGDTLSNACGEPLSVGHCTHTMSERKCYKGGLRVLHLPLVAESLRSLQIHGFASISVINVRQITPMRPDYRNHRLQSQQTCHIPPLSVHVIVPRKYTDGVREVQAAVDPSAEISLSQLPGTGQDNLHYHDRGCGLSGQTHSRAHSELSAS